MKSRDDGIVELERRFATGKDHKAIVHRTERPFGKHRIGKSLGCHESATTNAIHAHEVCIAESANRRSTILLMTRPKIAASEAAEDCWGPSISPFSLKSVKDFLN